MAMVVVYKWALVFPTKVAAAAAPHVAAATRALVPPPPATAPAAMWPGRGSQRPAARYGSCHGGRGGGGAAAAAAAALQLGRRPWAACPCRVTPMRRHPRPSPPPPLSTAGRHRCCGGGSVTLPFAPRRGQQIPPRLRGNGTLQGRREERVAPPAGGTASPSVAAARTVCATMSAPRRVGGAGWTRSDLRTGGLGRGLAYEHLRRSFDGAAARQSHGRLRPY